MKIEIHYFKNSENEPGILELTPEEYFDPLDEEENENFEDHGCAKFNHAEEYLYLNAADLKWTDIRIHGTKNDYNIRTEYYKGLHSMWYRKEADGSEEICLITQISESETHIARIYKTIETDWRVVMNALAEDLPDGTNKDTNLL